MAPTSATAVTSICRNPLQSGQRPVLVALLSANSPIAPTCTISSSRIRKHISSTTPRRSASTASSSRSIHSSSTNRTASALLTPDPAASSTAEMPAAKAPAPLSVLPLTAVLRSLATTTVSSSRLLLPPSLAAMSVLANTESPLLNPDRNTLLRAFMKRTFYAQFCAGEDPAEVRRTIDGLKRMGFSGVILGYAKEVVLSEEQRKDLASSQTGEAAEDCVRNEITPWAAGTMETVKLAQPGDFVALKFTGAGRQALYNLAERLPPSKALADAIDGICTLAASRGIRLLFDAEQHALQAGIDDWTLEYMRRFNTADRATIYGTYQAYLKHAPAVVSEHLRIARDEGFTLGVKLVRGAYLGSDPRQIIHDTKADTDACYDGITEALLRREWNAPLTRPADGNGAFPNVNMVLASHNADSVKKARALLESGLRGTEVAFAQLQGMADEVSCELVATSSNGAGFAETSAGEARAQTTGVGAVEPLGRPQAYKYLVWGSTGDCMKYLLRRAYENRDAVQRTRDSRDAMRAELWRRLKGVFGLGA